jgi:hypothetical protein
VVNSSLGFGKRFMENYSKESKDRSILLKSSDISKLSDRTNTNVIRMDSSQKENESRITYNGVGGEESDDCTIHKMSSD